MNFMFGKHAADYMVNVPARAPWLETVGEINEGSQTYNVVRDPGGNHFARNVASAAPILVRVYPVCERQNSNIATH